MAYIVFLSESAKTEMAVISRSGDKATIRKIAKMLEELQEQEKLEQQSALLLNMMLKIFKLLNI